MRNIRFFWRDNEVFYADVLSLSGPIIESMLRKMNLTHSFLFDKKVAYSRKRQEGEAGESVAINSDNETAFIVLLIVIDILEEAVTKSGNEIILDNYIK
ncbi:hypothetical protein [Piscirickettsia litoralis]|uniref:hypothetical protein n=1 Tax=Piscirickettsia litoralis TaxID=1891921 RepID=UPI001F1F497E|nr:hypothetical protein [Piscirickettsia litoralis]